MKCINCQTEMKDKSYWYYGLGSWDMDYPDMLHEEYICPKCKHKYIDGEWKKPRTRKSNQPARNYTVEALKAYALYHVVRIVDFENKEFTGWLVPKDKEYYLLPLNATDNIYILKRSHIKKIYHTSNGVLIPKEIV